MNNLRIRDRRRYKRLRGEYNVRIKMKDNVKQQIDQGRSVDVSAGGILIQFSKSIDIGKMINVRFLRPNSFEFFEGDAKVVRCELSKNDTSYYLGIEFINLTKKEKQKLDYYLTDIDDMDSNKLIKVFIEPTWNIVLNVNDRIEEILPDASVEIIDSVRMVSTELVENAVKYGETVPNLSGIEFEIRIEDDTLTVKVKNGVLTDRNVQNLKYSIEKIMNSEDRFTLYTNRLIELMESSKVSESQLGLYRMAYEAHCDLNYSYDKSILTVSAQIKI
ncbi:MAG: PilZ domain-containing protein [Spirochaetota bacterium]|nr:PilZ domain-containing protein [Spirochaetota bacterium]